MTYDELQSLTLQIQELIISTRSEIEKLEDVTQPVKPENSLGRVSRMDAINNKSVMEASLRSKREKLSKLELALKKVDQPNFGNCTRCQAAIRPARLMLLPESDLCIRCAAR